MLHRGESLVYCMAGLVSDGSVTVVGLCNDIAVKSERKKKKKNSRQ
jgi:hypothetical protein